MYITYPLSKPSDVETTESNRTRRGSAKMFQQLYKSYCNLKQTNEFGLSAPQIKNVNKKYANKYPVHHALIMSSDTSQYQLNKPSPSCPPCSTH